MLSSSLLGESDASFDFLLSPGNYDISVSGLGTLGLEAERRSLGSIQFGASHGVTLDSYFAGQNLSVVNPDYVRTDTEGNATVITFEKPDRPNFAFVVRKYANGTDWSQVRAIHLGFKGTGSGQRIRFYVYFKGSKENTAGYSFKDDSSEWRTLTFEVAAPQWRVGQVDWGNVSSVELTTDDKTFSGSMSVFSAIRGLLLDTAPSNEVAAVGTVAVSSGAPTRFSFHPSPYCAIDQMIIRSSDYILSPPNDFRLTYLKKSTTEYVVDLTSNTPITLILAVAYDARWEAIVEDQTVKSIPALYYMNGFMIDRTGSFNVHIIFSGMEFVYVGWGLTVAAVISMLCYVILRRRSEGRLGRIALILKPRRT
jgi:hypothetical protein